MARVNGVVEINAGEDREHIGLQEGDQHLQRRDRNHQASGSTAPSHPAMPKPPIMVMKPARTFSVMCPASILANRRTLCDSGRDKNDNTSMKTISGRMKIGMPLGTNSLKNFSPFL